MFLLRHSKHIIVCFFLFVIYNYAQLETDSIITDSLKFPIKSEFKLKLNTNSQIYSLLFIIKQPMVLDEYSIFILPAYEHVSTYDNISMTQLRNEINQSMNIYRQGQNKYQLGIVGDILGYVGTAAAAGFAVYHVTKYKKHYGLK